jgi:ABC-2 type transport system ATP-binding protein
MIRIYELTKKFGNITAVDNLNLEIGKGELFCFLGPNGAGKTTTIKMIMGTLLPTSGKIYLDGIDVYKEPTRAKALLGYVPDEPHVYEKLTAMEFLAFIADIYGLDKATARKRSMRLLSDFGLTDRSHELLGGFSHGMKQKILLSAALLHEPGVLFLDEPTVGLDPKSARMIKDVLRNLCDKGTTVFMSTHILEIAERMADRVGIIQEGKLVAVGTVQDLRERSAKNNGGSAVADTTLEDLFLELTGGAEHQETLRYLEE